MKNSLFSAYVFYILICLFSTASYGHDTTRIHPLITVEIAKSIKAEDNILSGGDDAYSELYKLVSSPITNPNIPNENQFLYWGTDFAVASGLDDDLAPYANSTSNVINGVIQEDVPVSKVLNHFHHATSGIGLTTPLALINGDPSSGVAMAFFNQAINWYGGYTEGAKETAYFVFGQSLHHVEDMSSPAHIHNDPHLTFYSPERDDYEGYYLPMQSRATLNAYFSPSSLPRSVTNPWFDIWNKDNPNSLVRYIHNMTTYQATLAFPVADYSVVNAEVLGGVNVDSVDATTPVPLSATGELAEMFPDFGVGFSRGLHWEEDGLDELAHWSIDGVGDFIHQYTEQANASEWWPIDVESRTGTPLARPQFDPGYEVNPFPSGRFYIEQLASGNGNSNPTTGAVVPVTMRTNFKTDWGTGNPTVANSTEMWEIYASNLLQPAVDYGAGFTQYWYDIANTPPYLVSVIAEQSPVGAAQVNEVYSAEWVTESDNLVAETLTYNNIVGCGIPGLIDISSIVCTTGAREFYSVKDRSLGRDLTKIKHIHGGKPLTLLLSFNEPMKEVSLIRFGKHNSSGVCVETESNCFQIFAPVPVVPEFVEEYETSGSVVIKKSKYVWEFSIPASNISGLNGKLKITVFAKDKNNHRGGFLGVNSNDGGELDGTPNTPARRNIASGQINVYPWYQEPSSGIGSPEEIAYSYDFEDGDQNHVLLFDTEEPTSTITIDLTL